MYTRGSMDVEGRVEVRVGSSMRALATSEVAAALSLHFSQRALVGCPSSVWWLSSNLYF
jgi:hypothetical protein